MLSTVDNTLFSLDGSDSTGNASATGSKGTGIARGQYSCNDDADVILDKLNFNQVPANNGNDTNNNPDNGNIDGYNPRGGNDQGGGNDHGGENEDNVIHDEGDDEGGDRDDDDHDDGDDNDDDDCNDDPGTDDEGDNDDDLNLPNRITIPGEDAIFWGENIPDEYQESDANIQLAIDILNNLNGSQLRLVNLHY